jgi:secretion/DNA translocation related TadE-like protein
MRGRRLPTDRWWQIGQERGAATFLILGVLAVLLALGASAALLAAYTAAAHRVRLVADLAALSGATAFSRGQDACPVATKVAIANATRVMSCDEMGDQLDYVVTVRVRLQWPPLIPGMPRSLDATAYAGVES